MLIVVSDFHLMDGTAGAHHVEPGVFHSTMVDIAAHAREANARDITLLFLGDVYDLVRTERWFEYPIDERPWGRNPSHQALFDIFDGVVASNAETFEMLSCSLVDRFDFPVEPTRVYVPGNHDTMVNEHPYLRRRVRETLGMPPSEDLFPRYYLDPEHGVFARHGHEFDRLNFEGSEAYKAGELFIPEEDYHAMPIGDVMACEYAAKLGPLTQSYLPEDYPNRARIAERLRDVVDVRPLVGMVRWVMWQVGDLDQNTRDSVNRAMREAAQSVHDLPFTKTWYRKHDKRGWDHADQFQAFIGLLRKFRPMNYNRILVAADKIALFQGSADRTAAAALEDLRRLKSHPDGNEIYYLMYGHTHMPRQVPIEVIGEPPTERYRVYLNTGTWRPTHRMLLGGNGFASWKEITYTLVYRPGETVSGGHVMDYPALESWTGTVVVGRGRRATIYQPIPKIIREGIPTTR
jgi:UDP-2,3-diacylglucosamine pyrophosphatase LpxH